MATFTHSRRTLAAVLAFVAFGFAGAAFADQFTATPTREVGPFIAGQSSPAPGGGWQASDDRIIGPSIDGQGGWSSAASNKTRLDNEIVLGIAHSGGHAWRVSNWYHDSVVNHFTSPAFAAVGESGTLTSDSIPAASNHALYDFWFRAPATSNAGGQVSTSLTDVAGRRMTYADLRDDGTNVTLRTVGISPSAGSVGPPPFDDEKYVINVSPALQRGLWYHVVVDATFNTGEDNDAIGVTLTDAGGNAVWNVTNAYSWEPAYFDGSFAPANTKVAINRIGFRVAENPDFSDRRNGATFSAGNRPLGFYFDDMSVTPDSGTAFSTSFEDDRWVAPTGADTSDCSVQISPCQTIAYAIGQANSYDRINIASGTYDLGSNPALSINKEGLILQGYGATQPIVKRTAGGANQALLVISGAKNVQVLNLEFDMDQTFIAEGIIANGFVDGLSINGNHFVQSRSISSQNSKFSWRNAISINDDNGNSQSVGIATGSSVSVTGNTIDGLADLINGVFLRSGVDMDNGVGTISGNTITTGVHDIHVRFSTVTGASSGTATLIDGNTLNGRGLEFDFPNAGNVGAITISNNHINALAGIDGIVNNYPADFSIMRLIGNPNGLPVTISDNTFAGYQGSYRGVLVENFPNTTFTGNTFTPASGVSDFVSLVVSNKGLNSDNPPDAPLAMTITANGNTFNGSNVASAGRAVEFLNDNANVAGPAATFGALSFGTAGSPNSFDGNLRWYFHLDDYNCETDTTCTTPPLPNYVGDIGTGHNTDVRPFTGNVNAANNTFAGVMPSAMTVAQQNALFAHTYDKGANPALGTVDYGLTETEPFVYVNATFAGNYGDALSFASSSSCGNQTVYFGVNAFATIPDGLTHVQSGGTVCVAKGTYSASVNVATNPVQIIGDGNTASDTVITGAVSLSVSGASSASPLLLQNLRVSNASGNGVAVATASHLAFDTVAFAGNGGSGLDLDATSDDVVITNSVFDSNVGAGLRTATTAQVSNVNITGSTFSNNAAGIILFGASGSGNGQITNWTIDSSQFLSNDNANASGFGGGIWLKTGGAGSVINGFHVTNSMFADNGSSSTLNQVGITVRARPNTTLQDVRICDNTFSETATLGTQLTGINVFDDTASGGTYQPIEICGTTVLNNIGEGISGLEQFNAHGTKPFVSLTGTLTLNNSDGFNDVRFSPPGSAAYVDDNYAGTPNGTVVSFTHPQLNGGSPVSATFGVNAFATINDALANVQSGGTIYVDAGTYAESSGANENLVVGIPVTILGEQATVDARTRDVGGGGDASETIIVPGVEDGTLALDSLGNSAVVTVNSPSVFIDGVVIDGDNPALTSGITLNGSNPDADSGAFVSGSNGTLQNIVFRNVGGSGIFACEDLSNCASSTAGGDNVIRQNRFTNITNPSTWGIGVYAGDDFYAQIDDNLFDQVRVGIQFAENDHLADTGTQPPQVQGNEIHATRIGLFFNLFYQSATTWTVSNNHIFASANAGQTGQWRGIQVESMQSAQTAVITGNIIDASALLGQRSTVGYALNNWTSSNSATTAIDGGSVSNADVGVLATDAMNYTGPVDGALIQNIVFNNIAIGAIYVEDTNEVTGSAAVTIGVGNTYNSVGHELVLAGAAPAVSFSGGSVDNALVRAAGTYLYGTPSTGPCTSVACTTANASINAGIADVAAGGTVDVEAGTFDENVIANKSVILHGPFNGVAGTDGSRGTNEAIISPATGIALKVNANDVMFDGFTIQNVADTAIASGGNYGGISDTVSIVNNRVLDVSSGSGLYTNGPRNTPVTNWTVSNNLFDDIQSVVGSGINLWAVTGGTITGNTVTNSAFGGIQVNGGSNVTISGNTITSTAHNGINIAQSTGVTVNGNTVTDANTSGTADEAGLTLYGGTANVTFACNSVAGSGTNGFSTDAAITDPFTGIKVFDNAITVNSDVSHNLAQSISIGSNYYGGSAATVGGSNAAGAQVADPLLANPIGNAACGDNTPTQIVLRSGSNQFALITNSFASPLVGRIQDALGGAVMGESMAFTPPGSGASANLATPSGLSDFNGLFSTTAIANSIAGPYAVTLADTNFNGIAPISFMLTNQAATALIVLDASTLNATYDGSAHAVTATTNPAGLSYTVTYSGSATAPTNAGSYYVVATITDPSYTGSTSGTLTIAQKPETLTLSNLSQVYDGTPKSVTVAVSPDASVAYTVTYNGSSTAPSAVGSYSVVATVNDPNYTGSVTATLTITAASAPDVSVSISNGRSYVQYGKLLTYTIVVQNIGTADVASLAIDDVLPVTLINGTWTCVGYTGATCAASGSGDVHDTAVIPQNGVLVYTLIATVNDDPSLTTDQIAETVTATVNGTPADSNTANNSATANTQIVIFRDGFETGGDGAQVSAAIQHVNSLDETATLMLDPAQAPQAASTPVTWLRGADANGRTVFAVDTLRIGTLSLMRLAVSDANGNLVPGAWQSAQAFALGVGGNHGGYQALLATGKNTLQLAIPAWASLPLQVYRTP